MWLFVWVNLPRKLGESSFLIRKLKSDLDVFKAKSGCFSQGNSKRSQSELAVQETKLVQQHYSCTNDSVPLCSFTLNPGVVLGQGLWPFRGAVQGSLFPWQQGRDTEVCQWPLSLPAAARTRVVFRKAFSWPPVFMSQDFTSVRT